MNCFVASVFPVFQYSVVVYGIGIADGQKPARQPDLFSGFPFSILFFTTLQRIRAN